MPNRPTTPSLQQASPSSTQAIISIPPMESFDDVRRVLAQVTGQVKSWILSQFPPTNFQGRRLSNVGIPQGPDDVVTLRYLASPGGPPPGSGTLATGNLTTTGLGGGIFYIEITPSAPTTIFPRSAMLGNLVIYRIIQGGTGFAITWGTAGGRVFVGAPPVPTFVNTNSVVTFVSGSDGNWYVVSSMLGFTQ